MIALTLFTPIRRQWHPVLAGGVPVARRCRSRSATSCSSTSSSSCAGRSCASCDGEGAALPVPVLREQLRRAVAALHRRVRLRDPARHPVRLGARAGLPGAAAVRAAEGLDRAQQHGGRRRTTARTPTRARGWSRTRWRCASASRRCSATRERLGPGGVQGRVRAVPATAGEPLTWERVRADDVHAASSAGRSTSCRRTSARCRGRREPVRAARDAPPRARADLPLARAPGPGAAAHGHAANAQLVFTSTYRRRRSTPISMRSPSACPGGRRVVGPLRRLPGARGRRRVPRVRARQRGPAPACSQSAIPGATVADVRESLALRERVVDFAVAAQGLDAAALHERFRAEF